MKRFKLLAGCMAAGVLLVAVSSSAVAATWRVPKDFATIQAAIDSPDVATGDTIRVAKGSHAGAFITKAVNIVGQGKPVINDGPLHGSGLIMGFRLMAGSDGTTISQLVFTVDLAIMNGAAVDEVTVDHCTFLNSVQAISNWSGSGWDISHNVITDLRTNNGGGIGILVGDYTGGVVSDNVVSHNTITGTLYVKTGDGGGYNGSGIVLYADFRDSAGAEAITLNEVVQNSVSLVSDTPDVVDVAAVELTDSRDDETLDPVIFDNVVAFNDLRGTTLQIVLTPENLDEVNTIDRNLGENRGHGLKRPGFVFGPGGN